VTYLFQKAEEEIAKITEPNAQVTKEFFRDRIRYLEGQLARNLDPVIRSTLKINFDIYAKIWGPYGS
jgi:hypothetical protein